MRHALVSGPQRRGLGPKRVLGATRVPFLRAALGDKRALFVILLFYMYSSLGGEERAESSSDPYEDFPSSSELARHDYLENLP